MAFTAADFTALATGITASNTGRTARDTAGVRREAKKIAANTAAMRGQLEDLGIGMDMVGDAVDGLRQEMGWRLAEQTLLLREQTEWAHRQAETLGEIADTLSRPDYTQARERLRTAVTMIEHDRYERAREAAESAVELAPYDPYCYATAGWAAYCVGDLEGAEHHFTEALEFARDDPDLSARLLRQTGCVAFAGDDLDRALDRAERSLETAEQEEERTATRYELALYGWASGDGGASEQLAGACERDSRYCELALSDQRMGAAEDLQAAAIEVEAKLTTQVFERQEQVRRRLGMTRESLAELPRPSELAHAPLVPPSIATHAQVVEFVEGWLGDSRWFGDQPNLQGALGLLEELDAELDRCAERLQVVRRDIDRREKDLRRQKRLTIAYHASGALMMPVALWPYTLVGLVVLAFVWSFASALMLGLVLLVLAPVGFGLGVWVAARRESLARAYPPAPDEECESVERAEPTMLDDDEWADEDEPRRGYGHE